ncbi:L-Fucosyltransferase, partial [Caligus rogercresseyi]
RLQLMDFLKKVEPELRRTFVFKEDIQNYVSLLIQQATDNYKENYLRRKKKKHKKPPNLQRLNITLVGVHVRKRDADVSMLLFGGHASLSKEVQNVIFMVVSDEMKWVEDNLLPRRGSASFTLRVMDTSTVEPLWLWTWPSSPPVITQSSPMVLFHSGAAGYPEDTGFFRITSLT